jgi:hypothetical protein
LAGACVRYARTFDRRIIDEQQTKCLSVAAVAGLCIATSMVGQTLTFTGGTNGAVSGTNIGASPYSMSLDGTAFLADCDDFVDNITSGEHWIVNSTSLSSIENETVASQNVYYDTNSVSQQKADYLAAGWLALQLTQNNLTGTEITDYSLALWDVFNPSATADGYNLATLMADNSGAVTDLNDAKAATYSSLGGVSITIYTPTDCTAGSGSTQGTCSNSGSNSGITGSAPQEFIRVPESSTLAFLGFDFAGAGLVGLYLIRRKSGTRS